MTTRAIAEVVDFWEIDGDKVILYDKLRNILDTLDIDSLVELHLENVIDKEKESD